MEKLNLKFDNKENIINSICWIVSLLAWLMFIVTGWISFKWLKEDFIVWTIFRRSTSDNMSYPIQMQTAVIYIIIAILMICALAGCIIYIVCVIKDNKEVKKSMLEDWSKFHFFPLFCASALFIIGECIEEQIEKANHLKDMHYSSLVFSILGLASLIFIYFMTEQKGEWYIKYTLKNGTFAILIILMWYNFCYVIYGIRRLDKGDEIPDINWLKGCSIAFSLIFGIGSLIFSFFGKDIVAASTNLLIYIGMVAYFFDIEKAFRADKTAGGVIDIIMLVLSVVLIAYLVYENLKGSSKAAL